MVVECLLMEDELVEESNLVKSEYYKVDYCGDE